MSQLPEAVSAFFIWLLRASWQAAVLAVVVLLAQRLLAKQLAPRWRYALWWLVVVRLVLPMSPGSAFSIFNWAPLPHEATVTASPAPLAPIPEQLDHLTDRAASIRQDAKSSVIADGAAFSGGFPDGPVVEPMLSQPKRSVPFFSRMAGAWQKMLSLAWFCGAVAMAMRLVWSLVQLRRELRSALPVTDQSILTLFEGCRAEMNVSREVELLTARAVSTPALCGVFKPRLLLPAGMGGSFTKAELRFVFLHELAHLKRHDIPANWLMAILQVVHWFNPVIWYAFARMRADRELACDSLALSHTEGAEPRAYGLTILKLLEGFVPPSKFPGLVGILEDKKDVSRRIRMIASFGRRRHGGLVSAMVLGGLAIVCLTDAQESKPRGQNVPPAQDADRDGSRAATGAARLVESRTRQDRSGPVLKVTKDGREGFTNIQAAINAAPPNAVVVVGAGIFEECLVVEKPLTIEGSGWGETSLRKEAGPQINSDEDLMRFLEPEFKTAQSGRERLLIIGKFLQKRGEPLLTVRNTKGVVIRGLRFSNPLLPTGGSFPNTYLVMFTNAQARIRDCAVVGGPGIGVLVGAKADVEMSRCLVAGVWGNGIQVGVRGGPAESARISDCDIRNCYHVGITLAMGQDALIERCRISGSAWHGIQYGDASPTIVSNLVFGHARSGIYAGGKSKANVHGNLFYKNGMNGVTCGAANHDVIEENTFAENLREGAAVFDSASPVLRRNIFAGQPKAIIQGLIADLNATTWSAGAPKLEKNVFWKNQSNVNPVPSNGDTGEIIDIDPRFKDPAKRNFSLAADSEARRERIGASDLIEFESAWPLQPEETAIVPEGESRDSRQWKAAQSAVRRKGGSVSRAPAPAARSGGQKR